MECKIAKHICYNCQQTGHPSKQCPNQKVTIGSSGQKTEVPKVSAHAFQMKTEEARRDDEVIF